MEWLTIIILCIQFGWVSPCVFDRVVESVPGVALQTMPTKDESECFAACYEDNKCIARAYKKTSGACDLFTTGRFNETCRPDEACYTLQRDEEDSMCARYVNV